MFFFFVFYFTITIIIVIIIIIIIIIKNAVYTSECLRLQINWYRAPKA